MRKLFVITGPSAIGKSYLMTALVSRYPDSFEVPKLISTRTSRPGEEPIDRQFVSDEQYNEMLKNNEFVWSDTFYGNRYGYTHDAIQPKDKHILINALPPMIAQFARLPSAVMVGLTAAPANFGLLERRLQARGDTPAAIGKRLAVLEQDVQTMADQSMTIRQYGKLFEIQDDSTIQDVIDWLAYNYL